MKKFTLLNACFTCCLLYFSLHPLLAQSPSVISGPACIDASAGNVTYTLITNSNSTTYGYRWYTKGDIEIVSTNGNKVTIRSVNKRTGGQPGYAKGRLFVSHRNVDSDPCGPFLAQLDIYKEFNLRARAGGVTIIGPACVAPGDTAAYSIDPVLSRNLDDEIGLDHYKWSFPTDWQPYYYSGDSTSVTLIAGSSTVNGVSAEVGKCNFGNADKRISLGLFQKAAKPQFVQKPQCLATDVRTVTVSVRHVAGVSYRWSKPSNWTIAKSGVVNNENFITLNIDGNPGQIIVEAGVPGSGKCPSDTASFTLTRSLGADCYIGGEACVDAQNRGVRTYTLVNAPLNSAFHWTLPAGWTFANADTTAQTVQVLPGTGGGVIGASVRGTNCGPNVKTLTVQQKPGRPATIAGADCLTPNTTGNVYSVEPVAGATGYSWSLSGSLTSPSTLVNGGNSITVSIGAAGGTLSVTANNGNCAGLSQTKTVNLAPVEPASISISKTCINRGMPDEVTFSVSNPVAGQTYEWRPVYPSSAAQLPAWTIKPGTPANAASVTYLTNGVSGPSSSPYNYSVEARALNNCGTSGYVSSPAVRLLGAGVITMTPSQMMTEDANGEPYQYGESFSATSIAGATYQWFVNGSLVTTATASVSTGGPNGNVVYVYGNTPGTVRVEVNLNGCKTRIEKTSAYASATSARMATSQAGTEDLSRQVSVYPNPSSSEFTLTLPSFKSQAQVALKTLQGRTVFRTAVGQQKSKLAPGKLTTGVYLLQVTLDGKTVTKKVQIQK
ncbi:MAG: hypothetical protein AVDCRST_MAG56-7691 [uncultured Cytophagales bacterium]|uniref:Uncharacterized protein n=1 Tax=uncultured Cytophagales bacterium TaxID=158755 RepID=A0A6J4LLQ4_9SPHI|nr:MAG: hypothetical protein AVDCRST_MAG56-7691 [uncultured Cytophagales bacterium]